jgi:hypothetical protein
MQPIRVARKSRENQPSLKSHFHFVQIACPPQRAFLTQLDEAPPQAGLATAMMAQRCAVVGLGTTCAALDPIPSVTLKTTIPTDVLSLVIVICRTSWSYA